MFLISKLIRNLLYRRQRMLVPFTHSEPCGHELANDLPLLIKCPQPIIFDVGANEGQSIELFLRLFKNPRIFSFEPSPDCFEALSSRSWERSVRLFQTALGDVEEQREFHRYELSVLNSLLVLDRNSENRFAEVKPIGTSLVETRTLDSVTAELGVEHIDLLKIDTQGFDLRVLLGASRLLTERRIGAIMVELNFVPMYEKQSSALAILTHLNSHGMHLVDFYEKFRERSSLAWCTAVFVLGGQPVVRPS